MKSELRHNENAGILRYMIKKLSKTDPIHERAVAHAESLNIYRFDKFMTDIFKGRYNQRGDKIVALLVP